MKRIFKYPLKITDVQTLRLPKGAEILSVHEQFGALCLWALVDDLADNETRHIGIIGTGHPIDDTHRKFIGTVLMHGGKLVWHVFEEFPG